MKTYKIQSTAKMIDTSSGGRPTVSSTSTNVTSPACGIPAAPILAAVDVILIYIEIFALAFSVQNFVSDIQDFRFVIYLYLPNGDHFAKR